MAIAVYERHLGREIYAATLLVAAAFLALFAFFDLVHELGEVGRGGYQMVHALGYVALTLPGRTYEILPIAVLIGTLYALTVLARHSEITVLRASGLSTRRLLASLARIGMLFVAITLLIGEFVAPPAEKAAQRLRLQAQGAMVAQEFRSGLWVKDGLSFINVRNVRPDASLDGVRVYDFDTGFSLRSITEAERAEYSGGGEWQLREIVRTQFEDDRASVVRLSAEVMKSRLNPELVSVLMVVPERMSLFTLYQYVNYLGDNRQKTERYQIALWKKLVYPLATLVMMVLALPFAYTQDRMGAVSLRVFSGIMLGIGFHMLNGLFSSLGVINNWTPFTSAIAPSVLFLLAAGALIWWVERR